MLTIVYPLIDAWPAGRLIEQFALVGVLITSTLAVYQHRYQMVLGIAVGSITLVAGAVNYLRDDTIRWVEVMQLAAATLFLIHVTLALARDIFASREQVTSSLLYGAVSVYLLIGTTFGGAHVLLETLAPGSYDCGSPLCHHTPKTAAYMYYSFITLATVGYGEIVPATPAAATLAYGEAVVGQMYTAILVARLVGMHLVQSKNREPEKRRD